MATATKDTLAFEHILDLEFEAAMDRACAEFGETAPQRKRGAARLAKRRAAIYAAVDVLTPEQQVAFGQYRAARRG